jgi:predicted  nucleic acid-binding Zn ribbon protein
MTRLAKATQCPSCQKKWAIQFNYYRVKGFRSEQYLGVCQHCNYIPSLRRFVDGRRQQSEATP